MVVPVRPARFVGPAVLVAGLSTLALAVSRGEASVYLLLVIPAVVGTGPLAFLGILLVFVGLFLTSYLWSARMPIPSGPDLERSAETHPAIPRPRRWGGVIFLGPLPLVFGSDPQMTRTMLLLGAILFLVLLALTVALLLA